jgi:formamidopyrimidine-DNA glycosylase
MGRSAAGGNRGDGAPYDRPMPELPEVQTVVDTLRPAMVGVAVAAVTVRRPDVVTPTAKELVDGTVGRVVSAVDRRGKRIVVTLADGGRFYVHLGMTGRLTLAEPAAVMRPHTHVVWQLAGGPEVRFFDPRRFGGVWWLGRDGAHDQDMGPEPLGLRAAELLRRLGQTRRAVKVALLDQSVVAGLGNIYVDESLHAAGIHPTTPARLLSAPQVASLNRCVQRVLRKAIRHGGSTLRDYRDANGNAGVFQRLHAVYGRAGQPCRRCRAPVERIVLGGRSTHFCPACQRR